MPRSSNRDMAGRVDISIPDLLRNAMVSGEQSALDELAAAGSGAVRRFRDFLTGDLHISLPNNRDRELIDNTMTVSAFLAWRLPYEYLDHFNDPRWESDSFVLTGLGWTGRQEAQPLLVRALRGTAPATTRLCAAKALALLPGPEAVRALLDALDDPEYLVQYQAIQSLGVIGNEKALDRLIPLATDPPNRGVGEAAARAVKLLAKRLRVQVDSSRIPWWSTE